MIVQVIVVNLCAIDGAESVNAKIAAEVERMREFISAGRIDRRQIDFFNGDGVWTGLMTKILQALSEKFTDSGAKRARAGCEALRQWYCYGFFTASRSIRPTKVVYFFRSAHKFHIFTEFQTWA